MPAAKITRRRLLAGAAATVLASTTLAINGPAEARLPWQGGVPAAASGAPLQALLVFADGNSVTVDQTMATDIGTLVDSPISQRCLRYYVTGHGDYRDSIVIDFRPETDGSREEVVFWFGCFSDFTASPPAPVGVATAVNLFTPRSTTLTKSASGSGAAYGSLRLAHSYVWADGEGVCSPNSATLSGLLVDDQVTTPGPPAFGGATGYNVYAVPNGFDGQYGLHRQNASPIPIGTPWTSLVSAISTTGASPTLTGTKVICTATVSGGSHFTTPQSVTIKNWWWSSRFRIQSAARPVIRTNADLVSMKAYFPQVTDSALLFNATTPSTVYTAAPMGIGGLQVLMQSTGERGDLGPETEWFAAWRHTGNAGCLTTSLANAEAIGTMPINFCDSTTNGPIDVLTRQYVAMQDVFSGGTHKIQTQGVHGGCSVYFAMDNSHTPNSAAEGWHLTKDPYFLEEAQFMTNYHIVVQNYGQVNPCPPGTDSAHPLPGLVSRDQTRALAWGLRSLFHLAAFVPTVTPSWILPRSHWTDVMAVNKTFVQRYIDNEANSPCMGVFGMLPFPGIYDAFQVDFLVSSVAHAVYLGFSEWAPALDYVSRARLAYTDSTGTSGWDNRYPTPYYYNTYDAALTSGWSSYTTAQTIAPGYLTTSSSNTPPDFAGLWAGFVREALANYSGNYPSFTDPSTWPADQLNLNSYVYLPEALGTLGMLAQLGVSGAAGNYTLLSTRMKAQVPNLPGVSYFKWALAGGGP